MIKGNQGIAVAACILISIPYIKLMKIEVLTAVKANTGVK